MLLTETLNGTIPANSRIEAIEFIDRPTAEADVNGNASSANVIQLPKALAKVAIVSEVSGPGPGDTSGSGANEKLLLMSIPADDATDDQTLARIREWVDQAGVEDENRSGQISLMLNLQHVRVFWSPRRIAVIAAGDRLETVRKSIIEVTYYVRELKAIEQSLAERWPHLEADTPLAFEFAEQDLHKQKLLQQRFQETISLRARLARVTPFLLAPHAYPPTLASQVGERLRERVRVHEQVEFVSDQIEVFEKVYEMCGQRASDFKQARTGHTLEWIIIILLAAEVILMAFDYLSIAGS